MDCHDFSLSPETSSEHKLASLVGGENRAWERECAEENNSNEMQRHAKATTTAIFC